MKTAGQADKSSDGRTEAVATEDAAAGDARTFARRENAVSRTGERWVDWTVGGRG
jgi:hypothetical protein